MISIEKIISFFIMISICISWYTTLHYDFQQTNRQIKQLDFLLNNSLPQLMYHSKLIKIVGIIHLQNKIPVILSDHKDMIVLSNIQFSQGSKISEMKNFSNALPKKTIHYNSKFLGSYRLIQPHFISLNKEKYIFHGLVTLLVFFLLYFTRKNKINLKFVQALVLYVKKGKSIPLYKETPSRYVQELLTLVTTYKEQIKIKSKKEIAGEIAKQVAHDIRSPLAALNMSIEKLSPMFENDRIIVRSAIQRIYDIANTLLKDHALDKKNIQIDQLENILITSLIDRLMTEKRMQFYHKKNIFILPQKNKNNYGLFAKLNSSDFKRVLSNLINNAIEAFIDSKGIVSVSIDKDQHWIIIKISDNGKGISKEHIHNISNDQYRSTKHSGEGLGLYHAKKTILALGGQFNISSTLKSGAEVTIKIPSAIPPKWFTSALVIKPNMQIIILDDDLSIHHVWKDRFKNLPSTSMNLSFLYFFKSKEIISFILSNLFFYDNFILLSDYELLKDEYNGLDLIKKYNLSKKSFLITSHYEDHSIQKICIEEGVKLIPKQLASKVPIDLIEETKRTPPLIVHLDDDPLVRKIWTTKAKEKNLSLYSYASYRELKEKQYSLPLNTQFFIDQELSSNEPKGTHIAHTLYSANFSNIYLSTSHTEQDFKDLPYIKKIIGKEFPEFI